MSKKPSQSLNISGGRLENVQVGGLAAGDLTANQTQNITSNQSSGTLTSTDVIELIAELEELFINSELSKIDREKALLHLKSVREEALLEEPDKDFAAKNLQRATKVLKQAGETVEAGTNLWSKLKPIINKLAPWFGVAVSFFL